MVLRAFMPVLIGTVLIWTAPPSINPQGNNQASLRLISSYDHHGPTCNLGTALDLLVNELNQASNVQGHIIFYLGYNVTGGYFRKQSPPGLIHRHPLALMNYLVKGRGVDPNRITITYGGKREYFQGDVWIVPNGVAPPEPKPSSPSDIPPVKEPFLFDEYIFDSESEELALYIDPAVQIDGFAKALMREADAVGYIVGYAKHLDIIEWRRVAKKKEDEYVTRKYEVWDRPGTGKRIAEQEKQTVIKLHGVEASRVITIDGGYRNAKLIELWIIPKGANAPKPTPTFHRRRSK
jgi:hypothetical protein